MWPTCGKKGIRTRAGKCLFPRKLVKVFHNELEYGSDIVSAYWRTKLEGIQFKISLKERGHSVWAQKKKKKKKKKRSFLMWTPKNGGHVVCKKINFRPKFANFYVKMLCYHKICKVLKTLMFAAFAMTFCLLLHTRTAVHL